MGRLSWHALFVVGLLCGCSGPNTGVEERVLPLPPAGSQAVSDFKKIDLLYVSGDDAVFVFSYPDGKRVQKLGGVRSPGGLCVDAAGDVFVTELGKSNILEYAHGGVTPIRKFSDPALPNDCAVDPKSGSLAVADLNGGVTVFVGARPNAAKHYSDRKLKRSFFVGYDDRGNLFADGESAALEFQLAKLPEGRKSLAEVVLDRQIGFPGGVLWDGTYLAVGDQVSSNVYRFAVKGLRGDRKRTVRLGDAAELVQFWIHGKQIVAADSARGSVTLWNYPAGGKPLRTIAHVREPFGVTVSRAPGG